MMVHWTKGEKKERIDGLAQTISQMRTEKKNYENIFQSVSPKIGEKF